MSRITFDTREAESAHKAFKAFTIISGMDKETAVTKIGGAIVQENADDWEADIKREVEIVKEWQVGEALQIGNIRLFEGKRYVVIQAHTTQSDWTPPQVPVLFLLIPEPTESGYPLWVQPTGAHDAYQIGDRVTHNEQNWESTTANNVWEPGVFGWNAI